MHLGFRAQKRRMPKPKSMVHFLPGIHVILFMLAVLQGLVYRNDGSVRLAVAVTATIKKEMG